MPTNRIRIVYDDTGISCKVWDAAGTKYNVSDIFTKVSGVVTAGGIWTDLVLEHGTNSLETVLRFKATSKDLKFDVDAAVISQILEMGATEDDSDDEE